MLNREAFIKKLEDNQFASTRGTLEWAETSLILLGHTIRDVYFNCSENSKNVQQLMKDLGVTNEDILHRGVTTVADINYDVSPGHEFWAFVGDRAIAYYCKNNMKSWGGRLIYVDGEPPVEDIAALDRFWEREQEKKVKEDTTKVWMLIDFGGGDFGFHMNKIPASYFKPDNYSEANQKWMTELAETLHHPTNTGKLTILQGPPGTGKTRYLRALMDFVKKDVCPVVLPVSLAHAMSQPRMLGQFTSEDDFENKKLLIVIEDGDELLAARQGSNSVISEFLNVVDGLMGELLDIHIVVTTNLEKKDFDPAVTRPGRLHAMMYFEALSVAQAQIVHKRETGNEFVPTKENYTLAEVYGLAQDHNNGVREKKMQASGQYL